MNARTDLSPIRAVVQSHRPLEHECELEINGAYKWPVLIQYHYQPGTRQVWDCPATAPSVEIVAIRDRASGKDVRGALPSELVEALAEDLARGGL